MFSWLYILSTLADVHGILSKVKTISHCFFLVGPLIPPCCSDRDATCTHKTQEREKEMVTEAESLKKRSVTFHVKQRTTETLQNNEFEKLNFE